MIISKKLLFVLFIAALMMFSNIAPGPEVCKAGGAQIIFSDNFGDGEMGDWTVSTAGSGTVSAGDWSLNIDSPESSGTRAMATSPSFNLDELKDYNVSLQFGFGSPIHWIEVFRNQHINAVIDNKVGEIWRFICRYDGTNYLVMNMSQNTSYNIEYRVHPESNNYDIYVGDIFQRTCDCDTGGPAFPKFRVGDTELGSSNYGTAMYDDFVITQPPDSDGDGVVDPNDNCPYIYNPSQTDSDRDETGNACDEDCPNLDEVNPVNLIDFSILASDWLVSGPELAGDLNFNDIVDPNDLTIFSLYWLSDCFEE